MVAPTDIAEHLWPYAPAPRDARPAARARARPLAGMARLAPHRAALQLLAAFDGRMLRDLDLGWDTAARGGVAGRA